MLPIIKKYVFTYLLLGMILFIQCSDSNDASMAPGTSGQGGSLARFAIKGDYLYVVDNNSLISFSITNGKLNQTASWELDFGVETIFPYQDNLFLGSIDAMYIFDLIDPSNPQFVSEFSHQVGCDPVVVQGNYAYVSLRLLGCNQLVFNDVVDILDVTDINNPKLVSSYFEVQTPYGIGIKDDVLYVCQGTNGLLLIDVSIKEDPTPIKILPINAYDVIINNSNNNMILVGDDGLAQYDVSVPEFPEELSLISTE